MASECGQDGEECDGNESKNVGNSCVACHNVAIDPSSSSSILGQNLWDFVPVVNDVRSIIRGGQTASYALQSSEFQAENIAQNKWIDQCYGQCHYSDSIQLDSDAQIGGPRPITPTWDTFSSGAGEAAGGVANLLITASTVAMTQSLTQTKIFSHGGVGWHFGLESQDNMNIVHIGNHPQYGVHIAFGAVKPFAADLHIYLQRAIPFFRIWRP